MTAAPEVLERLVHRAPLALACRDGVSGRPVIDGLVASAWPAVDARDVTVARRSPVSGLLHFRTLAHLWLWTHQVVGPGEEATWPGAPPPPWSSVVVRVEDRYGRYLPVVVQVDVPRAQPLGVSLSSAPARPRPAARAMIRGEVHDPGGEPLGWAVVRVDSSGTVFQTVADELGRFLLFLPHPEALPPLLGSPPAAAGLDAVSWPLVITVDSEPGALVAAPGAVRTDPPESGSIATQSPAQVLVGDVASPSVLETLRLVMPLTLSLTAVPA